MSGDITPPAVAPFRRMSPDCIIFSGVVALDGNRPVVADIDSEIAQVLRNIDLLLAAAGTSPDHIVSVRAYLTSVEHFPGWDRAWNDYFAGRPLPTRSTFFVGLHPPFNVEVEVIANQSSIAAGVATRFRRSPAPTEGTSG